MYCTLTLKDGTKLEHLKVNGNNLISSIKINEAYLTKENLSQVEVQTEAKELPTVYKNLALVQQVQYEDGWHIALKELNQKELEYAELKNTLNSLLEMVSLIKQATVK